MPTENKKNERVNVAVPRDLHAKTSRVAKLLDKSLQDAVVEAIGEWTDRNRATARKQANQLLAA